MDSTTYSKTQNFIDQESEFGAKNKPLVIVLAWPKRNLCHYSSQVNMQVPSEVTPLACSHSKRSTKTYHREKYIFKLYTYQTSSKVLPCQNCLLQRKKSMG